MKTSWSKILFIASDIVIAAYLALAFSSFDRKGGSKAICSKVNIDIADNATGGFLDAKVIKERLQKTGLYPIGKPLCGISTRGIEETLRRSPFVKTAECYKTEGGHVYISVTQRMPVIRIKADNGDDYYVDDNDCIMPRTSYTSDLIIASGSISRWYAINYISPLGRAIMQNDMWRNLIEQIHVTPELGVELVPRIGDHIIYIGRLPDGADRKRHEADIAQFIDRKLTRLEKFYKYGLSQVGWNKYAYINIEFDNQIICKRKDEPAPTPLPQPETAPAPGTAPAPEDGPSEGETENEPVPAKPAETQGAKTAAEHSANERKTATERKASTERKTAQDRKASPGKKADADQKAAPGKKPAAADRKAGASRDKTKKSSN